DRLFVVADGKMKLFQHAAGGREVLLDLLSRGEFFGTLTVLGAETYPDTAVAQTPACILSIRAGEFEEILQAHPALALKALKMMTDRLADAHERVRQLSSYPAEKRIAVTLLKLVRKFGHQQEGMLLIDVPLSRDDLAEMTGTTPETASRIISQFQTAGLLTSGRQWIGVLEIDRLEKEAELD
ncbi:MAG: Crp/Fnr family transcriptional regulator, partial [Anaerolineaceae bacterium]